MALKILKRARGRRVPVTKEDWDHQGVSSAQGQLGSPSDPQTTVGHPRASPQINTSQVNTGCWLHK